MSGCTMSDNIVTRNATVRDIPAIADLWKELADFHADRDRYLALSSDATERYADFILSQLTRESACLLVAEYQAAVIGFCFGFVRRNAPVFAVSEVGVVDDLVVQEEFRRNGVGQALLQSAYQWFTKRGILRIEVGMLTTNEISTAFWREMGFEPYRETLKRNL